MLSNQLRYRVDEITSVIKDINGFEYILCKITTPGNIHIDGYINSQFKDILEEGEYYYTKKAYLTSFEDSVVEDEPDVCFRIDHTTVSRKRSFMSEKYTNVKVNALIRKSPSNKIKFYGPMKTEYFCTTGKIRNELNDNFYIMFMGFHNRAKVLESLNNLCYVDVEGSLNRRNTKKPCYIVVNDVVVRKEVE